MRSKTQRASGRRTASPRRLCRVVTPGHAGCVVSCVFFFSSRRRHTRCYRDWSSDVCSSDLSGACCAATSTGSCWLPTRTADRKSTRLNSSHGSISYAVFCLKQKITISPIGYDLRHTLHVLLNLLCRSV